MSDDRYNKWHKYGDVKFYLSDYRCHPEQARFLLLKVIEQAVRDYTTMSDSTVPSERLTWESARDFMYDDEYRIDWGDWALNLEELLDILDVDIRWFREQTTKKFKGRKRNDRQENRSKK